MNLLFNRSLSYAWILEFARQLIANEAEHQATKVEHQVNTRIYNNAFCGLIKCGYPFTEIDQDTGKFLQLQIEGIYYQCPSKTAGNILRDEFDFVSHAAQKPEDSILEPGASDSENEAQSFTNEKVGTKNSTFEVPAKKEDTADDTKENGTKDITTPLSTTELIPETSQQAPILPDRDQIEPQADITDSKEEMPATSNADVFNHGAAAMPSENGKSAQAEVKKHTENQPKQTEKSKKQKSRKNLQTKDQEFQKKLRRSFSDWDDFELIPVKKKAVLEIDDMETTALETLDSIPEVKETSVNASGKTQLETKTAVLLAEEGNTDDVGRPETESDKDEVRLETAIIKPEAESGEGVTKIDTPIIKPEAENTDLSESEKTEQKLDINIEKTEFFTEKNKIEEAEFENATSKSDAGEEPSLVLKKQFNASIDKDAETENLYTETETEPVFKPKSKLTVKEGNEDLPPRKESDKPQDVKSRKGLFSMFTERKKSDSPKKPDINEKKELTPVSNEKASFIEDRSPIKNEAIPAFVPRKPVETVKPEPIILENPEEDTGKAQEDEILTEEKKNYEYDGGVLFHHIHNVKLKKLYGSSMVGPYRFIFWPIWIMDKFSGKCFADFLVHVTDQNGNETIACTDGNYKELKLTVDGKEFNVFATWTSGIFESHVSLLGKTGSIFEIEEEVHKEEPDVVNNDYLNQFRFERKGQPKHFVVPFKNSNRGEVNIPIIGYVEVNRKRFVLERREQNTLRYKLSGLEKVIRGHWEDGKFVFSVDDARFI